MNQQDKDYVESICKAFCVLPVEKREYLLGVADGMAAMAIVGAKPKAQTGQERMGGMNAVKDSA